MSALGRKRTCQPGWQLSAASGEDRLTVVEKIALSLTEAKVRQVSGAPLLSYTRTA